MAKQEVQVSVEPYMVLHIPFQTSKSYIFLGIFLFFKEKERVKEVYYTFPNYPETTKAQLTK